MSCHYAILLWHYTSVTVFNVFFFFLNIHHGHTATMHNWLLRKQSEESAREKKQFPLIMSKQSQVGDV